MRNQTSRGRTSRGRLVVLVLAGLGLLAAAGLAAAQTGTIKLNAPVSFPVDI